MPRLRRNLTERARFVAQLQSSGLSPRAFAEGEGIKLATLQRWVAEAKAKLAEPPRFVRVEQAPEVGVVARLQLGSVVLHLEQAPAAYLAALVRALAC